MYAAIFLAKLVTIANCESDMALFMYVAAESKQSKIHLNGYSAYCGGHQHAE